MPRKKTAKRAPKRVAKSSMNHYHTIEKEFMGIPAKFASQVKKDISTQRQKETKLKNALNKAKKSTKSVEAKLKAASKNKVTRTGKKQFNNFKKMHSDAVRRQAGLKKEVDEINSTVADLVTKHAKLAALSKYLNSFNKEWAKNAKSAQKTKAKKTPKTRAKRKSRTETYPTETQTFEQQRTYETPEDVYTDEQVTEETESTS